LLGRKSCDRIFTLSVLVRHVTNATLRNEMAKSHAPRGSRLHEHKAVLAHALRQHAGIPYEVEQHVCVDCKRVLDERTVRRAAA
jgi:hypothetical protein